MRERKNINTAREIAQALETDAKTPVAEENGWLGSLKVMKELFEKLPQSSLSQESQKSSS